MSMPAPETLEREKDKHFLTDAELIRRLGVPEKHMRRILPGLESNYGFPRKQRLFGGQALLAGSQGVARQAQWAAGALESRSVTWPWTCPK